MSTLRVDGGAIRNDFLMQFHSDLLGVTVERPVINETTALGVAYLAGLAVGFWESCEDIAPGWSAGKCYTPEMKAKKRRMLYNGWKKALKASMAFK